MKKTELDVWRTMANLRDAIIEMDSTIFIFSGGEDSDAIYDNYPELAKLEGKIWDVMAVIQNIEHDGKF